jgi:hypothetical protein
MRFAVKPKVSREPCGTANLCSCVPQEQVSSAAARGPPDEIRSSLQLVVRTAPGLSERCWSDRFGQGIPPMKRERRSSSTLQSNGAKPEAKVVRKQTHESTQAALVPIATSGEIFADGTAIELVRRIDEPERASLLHWDGVRDTIAPIVQRKGRSYVPPRIHPSILRELMPPTHSSPPGSTRGLLAELCKLAVHFVGLPEKFASVVARGVLASWIVRALLVAPALSITGPDGSRGNRLVQWLHCVCRHSLRMSEVTPAALCSLPTGLDLTLLISQATISDKVQRLLDQAGRRDQNILLRGSLLDLYGLQVVHSESGLGAGSWPYRSVQIPMVPTNQPLPVFDETVQHRISGELHPTLLGYRFANYGKASAVQFDASRLTHELQELAQTLAATTPDDADLQGELFGLLGQEDREIRSAKWLDFRLLSSSRYFSLAENGAERRSTSASSPRPRRKSGGSVA